ncbi:MAG: hypothetical protein K940chlam9_02004, partial [Chlamydiae bacterium]|nr:hypothetical protein [Chlamydiota bacterium]
GVTVRVIKGVGKGVGVRVELSEGVGVFPLGEVEDPPDEGEGGVEPTWVPVGTLLGVDRSVDVVFVALDRISSMGFPLESYLCP